jgi:hypothetical protein
MANVENINKLIGRLRSDQGDHFAMADFASTVTHECGTTFCLAGWANVIRVAETGLNTETMNSRDFVSEIIGEDKAIGWLGISDRAGAHLFFTVGSMRIHDFDDLPPNIRSAAGIRVLEILRDERYVDWDAAIDFAKSNN